MSRLVTMEFRSAAPSSSCNIHLNHSSAALAENNQYLTDPAVARKKISNRCFFSSLSVPAVLLAVVHVTPALSGCKLNESLVRDPGSRIEFSREALFALFYYIFSLSAFLLTGPSALAGETLYEQFNLSHLCSLGAKAHDRQLK